MIIDWPLKVTFIEHLMQFQRHLLNGVFLLVNGRVSVPNMGTKVSTKFPWFPATQLIISLIYMEFYFIKYLRGR